VIRCRSVRATCNAHNLSFQHNNKTASTALRIQFYYKYHKQNTHKLRPPASSSQWAVAARRQSSCPRVSEAHYWCAWWLWWHCSEGWLGTAADSMASWLCAGQWPPAPPQLVQPAYVGRRSLHNSEWVSSFLSVDWLIDWVRLNVPSNTL